MRIATNGIEQDYGIELARKAIHLLSLGLPILYLLTSRELVLWVLYPLTFAFLSIDVARHFLRGIQDWFYRTWGWILRRHESDSEKKRLNGATYVLISATICFLIFPKLIAVTAFSILIISDLSAALVGRRLGRHRFLRKSLEGSVAFFASAVVVVVVLPKVTYAPAEYVIGIFASAVGALIEAASIEIDDNLSIPIGVGVSMWLLYWIFLPTISVLQS